MPLYECAEHNLIVSGRAADDAHDSYVDEIIAAHEQLHRDEAIERPYSLTHGDLGWTVTDHRAEPGSKQHFVDTWQDGVRVIERLELDRLAAPQWEVFRPPFSEAPVFLIRAIPGPNAGQPVGQSTRWHNDREAIAFLVAQQRKDAQREHIRAARDHALAVADVAIDRAHHLRTALAQIPA